MTKHEINAEARFEYRDGDGLLVGSGTATEMLSLRDLGGVPHGEALFLKVGERDFRRVVTVQDEADETPATGEGVVFATLYRLRRGRTVTVEVEG